MPKRPSILKIMKSAGRDAVLISNQAMRGFHDSFISAFMEDAVRRTYLKDSGHHFDEELIPPLIAELEVRGETSKLIFLHLSGSHYEYNANYPEDQAYFKPDSLENEYLNSIRYTDLVLQRVLDILMETDRPMVMLYVSDHGEYLNDYGDGFYGHGYRNHLTRFEIDVPFFLVVNERFIRDYPTELADMHKRTELGVSHDNVSHTLLGLMGIYDATYQPEFDLSSTGFVETPRFIIERSNNITLLDEVRFDNTKFEGTRKDRD